jgi:hypothetical protein
MPGQLAFVDFGLHCRRRPVFRTVGSSNAEATAGPATLSGQLDVNDPSTANEENDPSGFLGVGCLRIWALGVSTRCATDGTRSGTPPWRSYSDRRRLIGNCTNSWVHPQRCSQPLSPHASARPAFASAEADVDTEMRDQPAEESKPADQVASVEAVQPQD